MGKLTATLLMEEGADVTVTIRQYKSGIVDTPRNVNRINYSERYDFVKCCDFIFSATASPNLTMKKDNLEELGDCGGKVIVDLALPRDVETEICEMENYKVYDISSFSGSSGMSVERKTP